MAPKSAYFSNSGRGAILFLRAGKESEPAGNDPEEETTMKKLIALALTALMLLTGASALAEAEPQTQIEKALALIGRFHVCLWRRGAGCVAARRELHPAQPCLRAPAGMPLSRRSRDWRPRPRRPPWRTSARSRTASTSSCTRSTTSPARASRSPSTSSALTRDGEIAEHWDNLAALAGENPSGHTQIDGTAEIADLDKTEENRKLVENFL